VKEKTIIEKSLDCEINPNVSETRGVFYFDNGHSFDRTLFYGNENDIFIFEIILFMLLLITTDNIFIALIVVVVIFEVSRTHKKKKTTEKFR
jgi:meckelin